MAVTVTVTPRTDAAPCPRVEVVVAGLDSAVKALTVFRIAEGRTWRVRGAVAQPVANGFQIIDPEAPFSVQVQYRAEMFDAAGNSLGFTPTAATQLVVETTWVHNPLDPWGAVEIDLADGSGDAITRPVSGKAYEPEQRPLAMFVTGRRRGIKGVPLFFSTDRQAVVEKFEAMFGDYDTQRVPVLCVRTPAVIAIPRTFYAGVLEPTRKPLNAQFGGWVNEWSMTADEAEPPFPGIVVPLLTRDDIDAAFDTRAAMDAAYATRLDRDRDFSKAGTA